MSKFVTFLAIAIVSAIAVGRLAMSVDPYQTSGSIKFLFFAAAVIFIGSIVGIIMQFFKKSHGN